MKTKDRILKEALRLFNEQGFANVTTAALAQSVGIAEGNLWYHFNNKRALMEALTLDFIESADARLELQPRDDDTIIEEYAGFLSVFAQELTQFGFLYRDQTDYGEHSPALLDVLPRLYRDSQKQFGTFFAALVRTGHLAWPQTQISDLATNATIIVRYGLEFFRESGRTYSSTEQAVEQIINQHLTLFEHELTPASAERLRRALDEERHARLAA